MHTDPQEVQGGYRWFFCAGAVAIAFSIFLAKVDDYLTNSPKEHDLGVTLRELRGAQHMLVSRSVDERQQVGVSDHAVGH